MAAFLAYAGNLVKSEVKVRAAEILTEILVTLSMPTGFRKRRKNVGYATVRK